MLGLRKFLDQLKDVACETPIEPELKTAANKERDKEIKEQQDLDTGVVLQAVTKKGEGTKSPKDGDLVYVHFNVLNSDNDLLYTTWAEEGGSGQPLAFVIGKGCRAPRAWELAVLGMTRSMAKQLQVQPSYGYRHPDCGMTPPPGVQPDQVLTFTLMLCSWYPAQQVRVLAEECGLIKHLLQESSKWEVARPPNEVVFTLQISTPAYDGIQGSGKVLSSAAGSDAPCRAQLGSGALPPGLEAALGSMAKGERSVLVIPADELQPGSSSNSSSSSSQQPGLVLPELPAKCVQVEALIELQDLIQVRDVMGDGRVMKRRLREGTGEFPVDAPLYDTRVRLHYRVRSLAGGSAGPWVYDTRTLPHNGSSSSRALDSDGDSTVTPGSAAAAAATAAAAAGGGDGDAAPLEVDTGCGELPEGLEAVVKLMVPGELAAATCDAAYAYESFSEPPPGSLPPDQPVEFEVELISFDREGYWQHMDWEQRWALAERLKDQGNSLLKAKKYRFAVNKYTHLLRLIESTRDYEEQEQVERADGYKAAVMSNLALAAFHQEEYARCIEWCDKTLQVDPGNAKAVFRKGRALSMKGDYDEADEHLAAAAEMDASLAKEVEAARSTNKARAKAATAKQKQQFRNFFAKS